MNAETAQCSLTPPRRAGRRSRPGAIFAACLALLLLAAAPAGARSLYFGAIVDGKPPTTESFLPGGAFHRFESQAGKGMSLVQWGQPWKMGGQMMDFQRHYFDNVRAHGSIPVLSWASHELGKGIHQPSFQLRDVYSGRYDAYLTKWAQDAKAWGHPFMLRFDHEMNGWWFPWSEGRTADGHHVNGNRPGDYVKAWRHVHDIFERVGATNVTWLWTPNLMSRSGQYPRLRSMYPGDQYVDWTGLSVYNLQGGWHSPSVLLTGGKTNWLRNSYRALLRVAPGKPVMIAETGSPEAGDGGARKAHWIRRLLQILPWRFPQVGGFMWFDWGETGTPSLPIASSTIAMSAFAQSVASSSYESNHYANLSASPIGPPAGATASRRCGGRARAAGHHGAKRRTHAAGIRRCGRGKHRSAHRRAAARKRRHARTSR